jgi:hypothetical protein
MEMSKINVTKTIKIIPILFDDGEKGNKKINYF